MRPSPPDPAGSRRRAARSLLDLETDAIVDLRARIQRLRARTVLPALVVYFVAAPVAVLAHVFGFWAILGRLDDGSYYLSNITILMAMLTPLPIVVGPAGLVYLVLRARARRAWAREHLGRGLPREAVEQNVARFG